MKFEKAMLFTVMVVALMCWLYSVGFQYSLIQSNQMGEVSHPLGHWSFLNGIRVDNFGAAGFVVFIVTFFLWNWWHSDA